MAWKLTVGYGIDCDTGRIVKQENTAVTLHFYHAYPGDRLHLLAPAYEYAVAFYRQEPDLKYIYTYDYEPEENWTVYEGNLRNRGFIRGEFLFRKEIWFRVMLRTSEEWRPLKHILKWEQAKRPVEMRAENQGVFEEEIRNSIDSIQEIKNGLQLRPLIFFLMTDSHYTVGGTWDDTVRNVGQVNETVQADGCIHLGDFTDGMVSGEVTREYVTAMRQGIRNLGLPLYCTLGNHDSNYFRNNQERFDREEMRRLYLPEEERLWYLRDESNRQLRMIFLDSFDPEKKLRYGFAEEELDWLEKVLAEVPCDWHTVIFSHVPPVPRLHYWSDDIRGSQRLTAILRRYQRRTGNKLLGFIHGHNHADQMDFREGFPIISIGCSKCEYFTDKKPAGAIAYKRELHTVTQELWDVLLISPEESRLDFVRFGAGEDRSIKIDNNGRKEARIPMKKVLTYGTFDLFHEGHYNLLKRAKALGDYLIVGVTTEHFDEQRGKINIVDSMLERIENVRKAGFADEIIIEDHEGQKIEDIRKYGVDIFTLGSDWRGSFDYLKEYCEVVYLERTPDISSTMLRNTRFPIIRMGIVGTGRIAPRFIAEARYVSGLNIQSVYNPHRESAERFAEEYELDCFCGEFEEFLDSVDAIYIASPHETHYDYSKRALLKRKHVICEKPLVFTVAEARELFALAKEKGLVLMEGIKTAYCPGFNQLVSVAKSGKIGDIVDVEACFSRLTAPQLREMADSAYGGAFLEFGSYTVLPILKLLGLNYKAVEIDSILAENGVDIYTKYHFKYDRGFATSKTGISVKSEGQLLISGTQGYILAESPWWLTKKFQVRYEDPDKRDIYTPQFMGDGLRYEISDFVSHINGRGSHGYKLTEEESVAMADIVERFMQKRQLDKQKLRERNLSSGVKIWAHRGCSNRYPENTMAAFQTACELSGLTGIELDVQLSKDGQVVVFHDETTDRLMDKKGKVKDFSLQELQQMHFRDWEEAKHTEGESALAQVYPMRIPTLEQVLRLVKPYSESRGTKINIELKNSKVPYEGMEEKAVRLLEDFEMIPYIVFSSFNGSSLKKIKEIAPSLETGILSREMRECVEFSKGEAVDALHPRADTVACGMTDELGLPVRVWNSEEPFYRQQRSMRIYDLQKLHEQGATDFITNFPEEYLE